MKRGWTWPALLLLAALACGPQGTTPASGAGEAVSPASPVVLLPDGSHLAVRLADDPESQMRGLMFVRGLPDDEGMLFLFDQEAPRSFWMKNCEMAIDMVWLDAAFRIVDITHSAPPCTTDPCPHFSPKVPARNVLEMRGGLAKERGLKEGDTLVVVGIPASPGGVV